MQILPEHGLFQHYQDNQGNLKTESLTTYIYIEGIVEIFFFGDLDSQSRIKTYAHGLFSYSYIDHWFSKPSIDMNWVQLWTSPSLSGKLSLPPSLDESIHQNHYFPAIQVPYKQSLAYFDLMEVRDFATEWLGFPSDIFWQKANLQLAPYMGNSEAGTTSASSDDDVHPKERKTLESIIAAMDSLLTDAGTLDTKPFTSGEQLEAQMSSMGIKNPPKAKTIGQKLSEIRSRRDDSK